MSEDIGERIGKLRTEVQILKGLVDSEVESEDDEERTDALKECARALGAADDELETAEQSY